MLLLWSLACVGTWKPPGENLGSQGVTPLHVTAGKKQTSKLHIAGARGLEVGLIGNCGEQPCVAALVSSTIHLVAWHVGSGVCFFKVEKVSAFRWRHVGIGRVTRITC